MLSLRPRKMSNIPDKRRMRSVRSLRALMQRAAEAERIALQCHIEAARLLQTLQAQHGFKSRRYVEFALAQGRKSDRCL